MRLTRRKAVEISIELWTWLAETGEEDKFEWPGWKKYGEMGNDCAFCQYSFPRASDLCHHCPYCKRFGVCQAPTGGGEPTLYDNWCDATTKKARKKYARQFLEQLKELK